MLAVIGIYRVVSYSVAQRTHEIGVRMALGASPGSVRTMVMRESLGPIILGMAGGVACAIASGRYLEHLVVGAELLELPSSAMAAFFLLVTALVAAWSAKARILSVDPTDALRAE